MYGRKREPAARSGPCRRDVREFEVNVRERPEPGAAARHPAAARCVGGGAASCEFEGVVGYLTTRPAGPIDALVGIGTKPMESTSEAGIPRSLSFCANERNESL